MAWSSSLALEVRALFEDAQSPVRERVRLHLEALRSYRLQWERDRYAARRADPEKWTEYLARRRPLRAGVNARYFAKLKSRPEAYLRRLAKKKLYAKKPQSQQRKKIHQKDYRQRMKLHPLKWEKEKARTRRNYRNLKQDPVKYAKYLEDCRRRYAARRLRLTTASARTTLCP